MRRQVIYALSIVVLAVAAVGYTAIAGNDPLLGLDLQGGASVILEPEPNPDGSIASEEVLDQAVEIIRNRVDGLGVREPEISRAGSTILVQIPGVEDQQRAIDLVGQTAELRFRPVLQDGSQGNPFTVGIDTTCASIGTPIDPGETEEEGDGSTDTTTTLAEGADTTTTLSDDGSTETTTTLAEDGFDDTTTTLAEGADGTTDEGTTDEGTADDTTTDDGATPTEEEPLLPEQAEISDEPTPAAAAGSCMVAVDRASPDVRYLLGPAPLLINQQDDPGARLTGEILSGAMARLQIEWVVGMTFRPDSPGLDDFNALASECANSTDICPPTGLSETGSLVGRIAVEIDGVVESAPTVAIANFDSNGVVISGGALDEQRAKDLALVLRFGSLPVELTPQESRIVSSTLGEDALRAGIVAGLIGLGLVSLYLLFYYRFLGLVAIASLAISGALLWSIIAWLGQTRGLALTLAGVTGLIVSIGVSVDSNVVFFEHLKEDYRAGRTVRSSVERSFPIAFSTIVKADVASLIAAIVLYFLTVGQVKGFALFLGLATILDLVATYFFMGPVIRWMARHKSMTDHPQRFGIPPISETTLAQAPQ